MGFERWSMGEPGFSGELARELDAEDIGESKPVKPKSRGRRARRELDTRGSVAPLRGERTAGRTLPWMVMPSEDVVGTCP